MKRTAMFLCLVMVLGLAAGCAQKSESEKAMDAFKKDANKAMSQAKKDLNNL